MSRLVLSVALATATTVAFSAEPLSVVAEARLPLPKGDAREPAFPSVAFDGEGTFLVVWQQGRDYYQAETTDIFCLRLSGDGRPLDREPVPVCRAEGSQSRPRVAFSNGLFLVVWQDWRKRTDFEVFAARVARDGQVLDPDGFVLAGGPRVQAWPDVAPAARGFLVAWQEFEPGKGYVLRASLVGPDARPTGPTSVGIAAGGKAARGGEVALARVEGGWFAFFRMAAAGRRGGLARLLEGESGFTTAAVAGPLPHFSGVMGSAASDGCRVLYAGTAIHGRGRAFRPCTGLLFGAASAEPLENPNEPLRFGASGWRTERMFCLHVPMPGVDGRVAVAYSGGIYLVVARGTKLARPPHRHRLFAARVAADGRRLDPPERWHVVNAGEAPASNPTVCGGRARRFLVLYESLGEAASRLIAKLIEASDQPAAKNH